MSASPPRLRSRSSASTLQPRPSPICGAAGRLTDCARRAAAARGPGRVDRRLTKVALSRCQSRPAEVWCYGPPSAVRSVAAAGGLGSGEALVGGGGGGAVCRCEVLAGRRRLPVRAGRDWEAGRPGAADTWDYRFPAVGPVMPPSSEGPGGDVGRRVRRTLCLLTCPPLVTAWPVTDDSVVGHGSTSHGEADLC